MRKAPAPFVSSSSSFDQRLLLGALVLGLAATGSVLGGCVNTIATESEQNHASAFFAEGDRLRDSLELSDGWQVTPPIATDGQLFTRVGFRFDASGAFEVEGRASYDGGDNWMPWTPAVITYQDDIAHNAHVDASFEGATHVQLRFIAPVEAQLSFLAVELFDVPLSEDAALDAEQAGSVEQGLASDNAGVISRSEWGAISRNCGRTHTPNRLSIHHTYTPNNDSLSMARRVRQIQAFHINDRGWCDIGYHFLIGQDGEIYQGRYENKTGAHVGGQNTNNVGISFIGKFGDVAPSEAMLDAGARIVGALAAEWGIPLDRQHVKGHREQGSTSCPGDQLYNRIELLLDRASGGTEPEPVVSEPDPVEPEPAISEPDPAPLGTLENPIAVSAFPFDDLNDTSASSSDVFDRYSCNSAINESGREVFYSVEVSEPGTLFVVIDDDRPAGVDIDAQLLGGPSADSCMARHDNTLVVDVLPGSYLVVADSYVRSSGVAQEGLYAINIDFLPY